MRISVSDLGTFQRYRDNDYMSLEECIAQIKRQLPPSPAMEAGSALHCALEGAQYGTETTCLQWGEYKFFIQCEIDLTVPDVRELKGEVEMETPSGPVTLVGVVDSIGFDICDYKLTGRWDAERLADSYQWRCYLQMFDRSRFAYKVFVGEEIKPFEWAIKDYHELTMFRYPGMEQDIQREIEQCAAFFDRYVLRRAA